MMQMGRGGGISLHVFANSAIFLTEVIVKYRDKINRLQEEVKAILRQEEEEKQMRLSEMAVNKARNLVEHQTEIFSRPARTWIEKGGGKKRGVASTQEVPHPQLPPSKRAKREEIKKKRFKKAETVSVSLKVLPRCPCAIPRVLHACILGAPDIPSLLLFVL